MAIAGKILGFGIPRFSATCILLGITALLLPNQVSTALSCSQDAAGSGTVDPDPVVERQCARLEPPCNVLCQDAQSAESGAATLEETAKFARSKAKMAEKRAVYFENLAEKRILEAQRPNWKRSRFLWKGAESVLRLLVPRNSRNSSRSYSGSTRSNISSSAKQIQKQNQEYAAEAIERADGARITADSDEMAANEAEREAKRARAVADEARRLYEACVCR